MKRDEKTLTYTTKCKKNPPYPKVRLLCCEVHRIKDPESVPERFVHGDWLLLDYVRKDHA